MRITTVSYSRTDAERRLAELRTQVNKPDFVERREANLLLPRERALLDEIEDLEYISHGLPAAS